MYLALRTPQRPGEVPANGSGGLARRLVRHWAICLGICWFAMFAVPGAHGAQNCRQIPLEGNVSAGKEWRAPIGEGWVIRMVPIPPLQADYTGWDIVVDREQPAGFPDALYLATPPYQSINQREIGTTYSLRAQDAIGWNPRSFRFLADPTAYREAKKDYSLAFERHKDPISKDALSAASSQLLRLIRQAATGQLTILDAHLVPGTADPPAFAQQWSRAASRSKYQTETAAHGRSTARGELRWMRFRITLSLPPGWEMPHGIHGVPGPCGD